MTKEELLTCLKQVDDLPDLPLVKRKGKSWTRNRRMIYEAGTGDKLKRSGHWFIDYASYAGGTTEEVPRHLIAELEKDGILVRAFPEHPQIEAWVLATAKE